MRAARTSLLLALLLVAAGCTKQSPTSDSTRATTTPATSLAPPNTPVPPPTAAERQDAGLSPADAKTHARHRNEDGTESEEAAADTAPHNALLTAVASTMAASTPSARAATPTDGPTLWQEGVNYTRLVPAQPTSVPAGQVEVLEFFWYGCPHCNAIDPSVESWRKTKPAFISFSRVPVMWSEGHRSTARLYYTLESLGKLEQLHAEVFKEIHANGDPLIAPDPNDTASAERIQATFAEKHGISEDAFKKAYHSFAVETALQRADQLVLRYRVEGVPTFVVNGKYVADVRSAGSPEKLLSLVDDLAAQEHKH